MAIPYDFIVSTDQALIERDIPLHARPFGVAMEWRKQNNIAGDVFDEAIWGPLMETYRELYPTGDFALPRMLTGCVGLRDQAYLAHVNIGYGCFQIVPLECIDVSAQELEAVWRANPQQVMRAIYSVADLFDFAYAVDDISGQSEQADSLLRNAQSAIEATAHTLHSAADPSAIVQSACLAAELALKGVLAHAGMTEKDRRALSHNLPKLARAVAEHRPSPATDDRLIRACERFPDYVGTRYEFHGMSRIELISLAMRSQYVGANAVRRLSPQRNLAGQIETGPDALPRVYD